jgi:hypothetical protein
MCSRQNLTLAGFGFQVNVYEPEQVEKQWLCKCTAIVSGIDG